MNWKYIIVHHSFTEDTKLVDWQGIRLYHMSWRYNGNIITEVKAKELIARGIKGVESPWRDIGYHFGIESINDKPEILKGRSLLMSGAHCAEESMNYQGIGICCVGNFDAVAPSEALLAKLVPLCEELMIAYNIPVANVRGHRDYAPYKSCPGKMFDMNNLRQRLQAL